MVYSDYKQILNVRTAAILTGSFVAGNVLGPTSSGAYKVKCSDYNQLKVVAKFTIGSLTDCDIKVEFSNDGTTYSQETTSSISSGEITESLAHHAIAADGNYEFNIPINCEYIKISALGNGTATGSSLAIDAVLSRR
jgi:hypothetical protein